MAPNLVRKIAISNYAKSQLSSQNGGCPFWILLYTFELVYLLDSSPVAIATQTDSVNMYRIRGARVLWQSANPLLRCSVNCGVKLMILISQVMGWGERTQEPSRVYFFRIKEPEITQGWKEQKSRETFHQVPFYDDILLKGETHLFCCQKCMTTSDCFRSRSGMVQHFLEFQTGQIWPNIPMLIWKGWHWKQKRAV